MLATPHMIAAALALLLAAAQASTPGDPALSGLDMEGWEVAARGAHGSIVLMHPALGDQIPGLPQIWVRTEPLAPRAAPSDLQRFEVDCRKHRMRLLEAYRYPTRNLKGAKQTLFIGRAPWDGLPMGAQWAPIYATACVGQ